MSLGKGKITIMGSGETAPTMVKVHRRLLQLLDGKGGAVFLDTPFGFQENADELSAKALEYFKVSLNTSFTVASLRSYSESSAVERERFLHAISEASYIFAGPGSPTYALENWQGASVADLLRDRVRNGATLVFSSAAALTLGDFSLPVYEIYKVGNKPYWNTGLSVMSVLDVSVAVIPHFNNQEGTRHDTRFCYMGENKLEILENELPTHSFIIGLDEHTGVIFDLDLEQAEVVGNGGLTLRKAGAQMFYESGSIFSFEELYAFRDDRASNSVHPGPSSTPLPSPNQETTPEDSRSPLGASIDRLEERFEAAVRDDRAIEATEVVLELEEELTAWSADTLQSEDMTRGRKLLRSMILRIGEVAGSGPRDLRTVLSPYITILLELRLKLREARDFEQADGIRNALSSLGVSVMDSPQGSDWTLEES